MVSKTRQVALPAGLLDQGRPAVGGWVCFLPVASGVRLSPAERVRPPMSGGTTP